MDCIYIRPSSIYRVVINCCLPTGQVVTRGHVNLAVCNGMPTNLKITNKTVVTLYNAVWTAGVEYDLESQEDIEDKAEMKYNQKSEAKEDLDEDYDEVDPNKVDKQRCCQSNVAGEEEDIVDDPVDDPQLLVDATEE